MTNFIFKKKNKKVVLINQSFGSGNMLYDSYGRVHNYLRISLTDACNLRCRYCMPDEKVKVTPHEKPMQKDEIVSLAKIFLSLGANKIRLTGGEPLVRSDAKEIIEVLGLLPAELSISTNGVLADEFIEVFKKAGIQNINVSLDTLNADDFFAITQRGYFKKILQNIYLLLKENFKVKVNIVVMKGVNENSILDFVEWTKDFSLDVRFIELMPFAGNNWHWEKVFSHDEMLERIEEKFSIEKMKDGEHDTTKYYRAVGHRGSFGIISTMTKPFCSTCNRLRLTADGKMKNCLFSTGETDLLAPFRKGEDIVPLIQECLSQKKKERGGQFDFEKIENRAMVAIGG